MNEKEEEEEYNEVDEKFIKILKKALNKQKKGVNIRGTAYFTDQTVEVERKYMFLRYLYRKKVKMKGSDAKLEKYRVKAKCKIEYLNISPALIKFHKKEIKKQQKSLQQDQ